MCNSSRYITDSPAVIRIKSAWKSNTRENRVGYFPVTSLPVFWGEGGVGSPSVSDLRRSSAPAVSAALLLRVLLPHRPSLTASPSWWTFWCWCSSPSSASSSSPTSSTCCDGGAARPHGPDRMCVFPLLHPWFPSWWLVGERLSWHVINIHYKGGRWWWRQQGGYVFLVVMMRRCGLFLLEIIKEMHVFNSSVMMIPAVMCFREKSRGQATMRFPLERSCVMWGASPVERKNTMEKMERKRKLNSFCLTPSATHPPPLSLDQDPSNKKITPQDLPFTTFL